MRVPRARPSSGCDGAAGVIPRWRRSCRCSSVSMYRPGCPDGSRDAGHRWSGVDERVLESERLRVGSQRVVHIPYSVRSISSSEASEFSRTLLQFWVEAEVALALSVNTNRFSHTGSDHFHSSFSTLGRRRGPHSSSLRRSSRQLASCCREQTASAVLLPWWHGGVVTVVICALAVAPCTNFTLALDAIHDEEGTLVLSESVFFFTVCKQR